jgi:outer membrane protein OmpA-like peptidoglycan-associated protein
MVTFKILSLALIVGLSSAALASNGAHRIKGYLSTGSDARFVAIEAGRDAGVTSGEIFRTIRPARQGQATPVETGLLKVIAVYDYESVAEVIQQGTAESQARLGAYADIMAGDLALVQRLVITPSKVLAPEVSVKFSALFDDPKAQPETFELTLGGRSKLRELAQGFGAMKVGMLMVEGHTDQRGDSNQNQIESYQRALTVRQYLIDDLGFDESRVTAVGLGESEPVSNVVLPGNAERSRRIVLKVVPMPNAN